MRAVECRGDATTLWAAALFAVTLWTPEGALSLPMKLLAITAIAFTIPAIVWRFPPLRTAVAAHPAAANVDASTDLMRMDDDGGRHAAGRPPS